MNTMNLIISIRAPHLTTLQQIDFELYTYHNEVHCNISLKVIRATFDSFFFVNPSEAALIYLTSRNISFRLKLESKFRGNYCEMTLTDGQ